jgi:hypothetical protein
MRGEEVVPEDGQYVHYMREREREGVRQIDILAESNVRCEKCHKH